VQVYTGNCKGKTTAALGLAFRAMGSGFRTYVGQFMKGQQYGELESARMVAPFITIEQYGRKDLVHVKNPPLPEDVRMAADGLEKARAAMMSGEYGHRRVRRDTQPLTYSTSSPWKHPSTHKVQNHSTWRWCSRDGTLLKWSSMRPTS
jgi:hypothetical protein